jgi:carbon-monoxide dehydrogenase medium subunit
MLLPGFLYHRPREIKDALAVLADYGDQAALLAGGTDLLVNMKRKQTAPDQVVGLEAVSGLKEIKLGENEITLGPMLTATELAQNPKVNSLAGVLSLGASLLGGEQVRNRATLGGNVANARPAADLCLPLLALGAKALLKSASDERVLDLDEFFLGPGETARKPTEMLTALIMETESLPVGYGYEKLGLRQAMEIALVNVAVKLVFEKDKKTIRKASISLGAVAPRPILAKQAGRQLVGAEAGEDVFKNAARKAVAEASPIDDHRGSAWYRSRMIEVLAFRAFKQAWNQVGGG